MSVFIQMVRKELLLLRRDWHALALLFIMPAFFILVMSLAMRDMFKPGREGAFTFYLTNSDTTALSKRIATSIAEHRAFRLVDEVSVEARVGAVRRGKVQFAVEIPVGFTWAMLDSQPRALSVQTGPSVNGPTAQLFLAAVREAVSVVYLQARFASTMPMMSGGNAASNGIMQPGAIDGLIKEQPTFREGDSLERPTSVQQNVPAWLVFAMFFVALPLSTTWLQERTQGTFAKLKSMGIGSAALLFGKLVPYLLVNVVQVVLMLAVGVWVVPALGGDALTLGHSFPALAAITVAVGVAAVSYALLIANLVSTMEQATILTGATNLLLGALGGVMVPRNVMPVSLQQLSNLSPMSWGLEGYLDVLLRDGNLRMVAPRVLLLFAFAAASLIGAALLLKRSRTAW